MSYTLLLRDVCEAVEVVANKYKSAEIPALCVLVTTGRWRTNVAPK